MKNPKKEVIGIIPAGGKASRIAPLPCSKELYPVGFHPVNESGESRPKVVSHYLLEKMRLANITKVFIVIREGKWDIPAYFGDGKMLDMHIAYLMMDLPYGVPYTLDQAYPFVQDGLVALGFPDIIFKQKDAYKKLLAKQAETNAAIVLGLFPAHQPQKTDMVDLDENGRVCSIYIKPDHSTLSYSWEIAVWSPVFTQYMHNYVLSRQNNFAELLKKKELFVGDILHAAIQENLHVESVLFKDDCFIDIGSPEDLFKAVRILSQDLKDF
ncbi:MAG: nucleotidyltransferase family protein [Planctomycetota bacterium]|jgi:glucose-1-phosphate thymidylyltransferase